jgi:hypothetical protein
MGSLFAERMAELMRDAEPEIQDGKTLGVWMADELFHSLTALASEIGVTRSTLARELLTVAVAQAWEDVRPDLYGQMPLLEAEKQPFRADVEAPRLKPRKVKRPVAKPPRKAGGSRSRAKGK